jgi:hypothetical protein
LGGGSFCEGKELKMKGKRRRRRRRRRRRIVFL